MSGTTTASDLAGNADLAILEVVGDPARPIDRIASLSSASSGTLTFVRGTLDAGQRASLCGTVVICGEDNRALAAADDLTLLITADPRLSFLRAARHYFAPAPAPPGIHPTAVVGRATIDPGASIGAYCVIGDDCRIGAGSVLYPGVILHANVRIGANVSIQSGTVIGAAGFGYERGSDGRMEHFPHVGGVVIEDDVDIGSNTSIDRGTLDDTIIKCGAKIDNLVHIAHNCVIGEDAVVIALAMVGGSVRIGDRAWIAPAATIMNQVSVADDATVGLGAVATRDVSAGATVMGSPAQDAVQFKRWLGIVKRLLAEER